MSATQTIAPPRRRPFRLRRQLIANPMATVGLALVVLVVGSTLILPWMVGWDPVQMSAARALQGPSAQHWLGTDQFGRDLLSRIVHGGEISLLVGVAVTLVAVIGGVMVGCAAGYVGGWTDAV